MHPEEIALIADIHADPKNQWPRLLYADWLEDNGAPEYAEFIRLQCQEPNIDLTVRNYAEVGPQPGVTVLPGDPGNDARRRRLEAIFPAVYSSRRFVASQRLARDKKFVRGLEFRDIDSDDPFAHQDGSLVREGLLVRYRFTLYTSQEELVSHLDLPVMEYVDELCIWLERPDLDSPDEVQTIRFDAGEIDLLANWPMLDRLEEIGLYSPLTEDAEGMVRGLIEPRVYVSYR